MKPEFFFDERPPRPEVKVRLKFCSVEEAEIRTRVGGLPSKSHDDGETYPRNEPEHLLQENQFCDKQSEVPTMEWLTALKGLG